MAEFETKQKHDRHGQQRIITNFGNKLGCLQQEYWFPLGAHHDHPRCTTRAGKSIDKRIYWQNPIPTVSHIHTSNARLKVSNVSLKGKLPRKFHLLKNGSTWLISLFLFTNKQTKKKKKKIHLDKLNPVCLWKTIFKSHGAIDKGNCIYPHKILVLVAWLESNFEKCQLCLCSYLIGSTHTWAKWFPRMTSTQIQFQVNLKISSSEVNFHCCSS